MVQGCEIVAGEMVQRCEIVESSEIISLHSGDDWSTREKFAAKGSNVRSLTDGDC
jgi:hypothetical protein